MKSIRTFFLFISTCMVSCVPSHIFHNTNLCQPWIDNTGSIDIDLQGYTAYYRVIYRNTDSLENVYFNRVNEPVNQKIHITDIQYILINDKTNKFMQFSFMPNRYVNSERIKGYYLDSCAGDYNTNINIYNLNLLYFGDIINNQMAFIFKDGTYNRFLSFYRNDSSLCLTSMHYPARKHVDKRNINIRDLFSENYTLYIKMDTFNLILRDYINTFILTNRITFSTFKHSWVRQGNGSKNMILLEYQLPIKTPNGTFTNLYFVEKGDRFNFLYPAR